MISTPCCRSISNVVTPKWRDPTRGIRMVIVPSRGFAGCDKAAPAAFSGEPLACVDSMRQAQVKPRGIAAPGYQQNAATGAPGTAALAVCARGQFVAGLAHMR